MKFVSDFVRFWGVRGWEVMIGSLIDDEMNLMSLLIGDDMVGDLGFWEC